MILGIGVDLTSVIRIQKIIEKYNDAFLNKIYSKEEIQYCEQFGKTKFAHYAARFAAKEAFIKAAGGHLKYFKFNEVKVINDKNGKPILELSKNIADNFKNYHFHISLTHTEDNAIAFVVAENL